MEIFLLYPLNLSADPPVTRSSIDHLHVEGCDGERDAKASRSRRAFTGKRNKVDFKNYLTYT